MTGDWRVAQLLADKNFRALLEEVNHRCVTWDEFLSRPQPQDMSPLDTWAVLSDLRRCTGIKLLPRGFKDTEYWYTRTHEISDIACEITRQCHSDSHMHAVLSSAEGQHFLVKSRVNETIAAAQLDGLAIAQADVRSLLRMGRSPQNSTEKLVSNIFTTLENLQDLVGQRFSVELLVHLAESMLEGVELDHLGLCAPREGTLVGVTRYDEAECRRMSHRQMEDVCRYLNQEVSGPYDPRVLQGLLMGDAFSLYRPLGLISAQVGRMVGRLHAMKCGLPVLGLLAISEAKLEYEDGRITAPDVTFDIDAVVMLRRRNRDDLTPEQTINAQLALYALHELAKDVAHYEQRDAEMREILWREPLLNQRQRSILARALRIPDSEFRIRYHKTNHRIAYATARRDLLELAEKDYLVMEQRGKAFVFTRGPKLDDVDAAARLSS